ncbi:LysR family transcriptional regulator (plasmid) [Aquicoccus sp. G2-2]|uniref:LysR family transcriptional regulator n=1 Tax=Aquicoccus sp. G2-2 TaxID=3092120 RepID=UPI002AE031A7|nr:LysR family transcriptional regulator [Aquicoccus sp. G2-2]MEA1111996.1 LysR family transcriptional regulator [Aquicoccus sp. G2-2]
MKLQRLVHFVTVADAGSFTRAAERIGMRQPPLSQSIRRLEDEVGVKLFDRTPLGVALTAPGAAFLPEAREAIAAAQRATTLAQAAQNPQQRVRIGVVSLALFEVLPEFIAAAHALDVTVDIDYTSTNEQISSLACGDLDLGLLTPPVDATARMKVVTLADEPVVAALPSAMAGTAASVSLAAIHRQLILYPRHDGPVLYDAITNLFRTAGLPLSNTSEAPASMLATLALVAAGIGAALVPAAVARNVSMQGLVFRPLDSAKNIPTWPIALAHMPLSSAGPAARLLNTWSAQKGAAKEPSGRT